MTNYFAYGSNLSAQDWADFCGTLGVSPSCMQPVAPAWLPDMELVSNHFSTSRGGGALNVQPAVGALVPGMLFELTDEGWEVLRKKEGVRWGVYDEVAATVLRFDGSEELSTTFVLNPERRRPEPVPMTDAYLSACREGYKHYGLDEEFLDAAARGDHAPLLDSVFVYGTLMRGERRSPVVANHKVSCALLAEARGRLEDCGDFPGMVLSEEGEVYGEFYRFDDIASFLADADRIEGFYGFGDPSNLFRRIVIYNGVGDGRVRQAWAYILCQSRGPTIASGNWRLHRNTLEGALGQIVDAHAQQHPDFWQCLNAYDTRFNPNPTEVEPYDRASAIKALANVDLSERAMAIASGQWAVGVGFSKGGS